MQQNQKLQSQLHPTNCNLREIAALRAISQLKQDLCTAKQHASGSALGISVTQQHAEQHAAELNAYIILQLHAMHVFSLECLLQTTDTCKNPTLRKAYDTQVLVSR